MNIRKLIAGEVRQVLAENKEAAVQALKSLEALGEEELQAILNKALPLVKKDFPKWADQQGGISEELEDEPGALKKAGATAAVHTPLGRDALALLMTTTDRATPIALRVGTVLALVNLVSPVDMGTILSGGLLDVLGPLAALDDVAWLKLMQWRLEQAGLPSKRIYDRISQLAGEKDVPGGDVPENPAAPKKPGFLKRMMGKNKPDQDINEMKINKTTLYKIIKEEVEVVLTNEEAEEMFNLDMSALLDEMISEEEKDEEGYERPLEASLEEEDTSFSDAAKDIEKKGTEGVFTAKAKKAGMGVQAYADKVLKKDSEASTKTKRQAAFAKGAATVARENK